MISTYSPLAYPGNVCLWNPKSWALEFEMQLKESGIPLTIGFQNPNPLTKTVINYLECGLQRVEFTINPRLLWIPLHRANLQLSILHIQASIDVFR